MRFCSLGSGSGGNALLVGSDPQGYVLLDCGFGLRELEARFATKAVDPQAQLRAILVTHEHGDHIGSAYAVAAKYRVPLIMSHGTAKATRHLAAKASYADVKLQLIDDGEVLLHYAELAITAFSVPHDSAEPLQFTFQQGGKKLGVLTDLGMSTPHVVAALRNCDSLVLECNHDEAMLANGPYTRTLKIRIGGNWGHLSNRAAAELLSALRHDRMRHVICAHLSAQNNLPDLARAALAAALNLDDVNEVGCASQTAGFDWRDV